MNINLSRYLQQQMVIIFNITDNICIVKKIRLQNLKLFSINQKTYLKIFILFMGLVWGIYSNWQYEMLKMRYYFMNLILISCITLLLWLILVLNYQKIMFIYLRILKNFWILFQIIQNRIQPLIYWACQVIGRCIKMYFKSKQKK